MRNAVERLVKRLYGRPILRNVLRGELVEQMILDALGPDWQAAADYGSWDLESSTGARIQARQSAAQQSWAAPGDRASRPCFSISSRRSYSEKDRRWSGVPSRNADLYVFAWHPLTCSDADHRDPHQWRFFVVKTSALPTNQASIGLAPLSQLAVDTDIDGLEAVISGLVK